MTAFELHHQALVVRPLTADDAPYLYRWLNDPMVLQYYEGRDCPQSMTAILTHYLPKSGESRQACLISWHHRPIGYLQLYHVDAPTLSRWTLPHPLRVLGLDLFIGEPRLWNQGIGTQLVQSTATKLISRWPIDAVAVDPRVDNERAVHVYEKAGFQKIQRLEKAERHEGQWRDCWLMLFPIGVVPSRNG